MLGVRLGGGEVGEAMVVRPAIAGVVVVVGFAGAARAAVGGWVQAPVTEGFGPGRRVFP